ncbi:MAG: gamma-glutamyl-gamma-aminobutyrate hydrolase family protein [Phycisphaerales bacterium]|nr:MAG: gamma-glutamyl-gamma-aminobutyrate hydrolase family protein [Phycisphaerales bacterium]
MPPERRLKRSREKTILRVIIAVLLLCSAGAIGFRVWQWGVVPGDAPIIGLSLDTAWHSRLGFTSKTYETALSRVDARVRSIRPDMHSAKDVLDDVHALILSGGGDVDPALSGADPSSSRFVDRERDELEMALIQGAIERRMPILGICRGIQILNVAHGGTLRGLRNDPFLHDIHGVTWDSLSAHDVTIMDDSLLARIVGAGEHSVNSMHEQAVDQLGEGLRAVARSPDGTIEALERTDRRFVIGIQWHPEILSLEDSSALAVFRALVHEANAYRE